MRQYRKYPNGLGVTRSFYLPAELLTRVEQEAQEDGHHNYSTVVTKALTEHFARRDSEREERTA